MQHNEKWLPEIENKNKKRIPTSKRALKSVFILLKIHAPTSSSTQPNTQPNSRLRLLSFLPLNLWASWS
jgi:hypothetical protein